jgi:hypothetical protein
MARAVFPDEKGIEFNTSQDLIPQGQFWRDWARHGNARGFLMDTIDQHGQKEKPTRGIPCIESRMLAKVLSDGREAYSYDELSEVATCDVRGRGRGYLLTARDIVLREKGFVFRPMRNLGLRRLTQQEVSVLDDRFTHVRRTHKKTLKELGTVDLASVPEAERISCVAKIALAEMTVHAHHGRQMKKLEESVGTSHKLDLTKTLEAFRG